MSLKCDGGLKDCKADLGRYQRGFMEQSSASRVFFCFETIGRLHICSANHERGEQRVFPNAC